MNWLDGGCQKVFVEFIRLIHFPIHIVISYVWAGVATTDQIRSGGGADGRREKRNRGVGISFTPSSVAARGLPDECQTTTGRRPAQKRRPNQRANPRFPWASTRPPMHLRRGIRPHPRRCRHSKPLASIAPQPFQNTEERVAQLPWEAK